MVKQSISQYKLMNKYVKLTAVKSLDSGNAQLPPTQKKALVVVSAGKLMLTLFFDYQDVVDPEYA